MKSKANYNQYLNEVLNADELDYLTVVCSTRSKGTANKAKLYLKYNDFAAALKLADPIRYNVGYNDYGR